jgi:recombination protein RecR
MKRPAAVKELIEELKRLPGIGQKTAERLSFYLMRGENARVEKLAHAILTLLQLPRHHRSGPVRHLSGPET